MTVDGLCQGFQTQALWFSTCKTCGLPFVCCRFSAAACLSRSVAHRPCPLGSIYLWWKPQLQGPPVNLQCDCREQELRPNLVSSCRFQWRWLAEKRQCLLWSVSNIYVDLRGLCHDISWLLELWFQQSWLIREIVGTYFYQYSQHTYGTWRAAWYRKITGYEVSKPSVLVCPDICFPRKQESSQCVCILSSVGKPQF